MVRGIGVNGQAKEFKPLSTQKARRFFLFFLACFAPFAVDEPAGGERMSFLVCVPPAVILCQSHICD